MSSGKPIFILNQYLKHCFISVFFLLVTTIAFSQKVSKTVYKLEAKERLNYIIENSYQIRSENLDTGLSYMNYAIELAEQYKNPKKQVLAYKEKGIIYYYLGNYEEELVNFQKGLKIAESIGDKALQGDVLKEIGSHATRQNELRKAIDYHKRAEKLCRAGKDMTCVASAMRNRGRVYLKLNDIDSAEIFFMKSYEIKKEMNDSIGLPYAFNDLSEIAFRRNDFENSIKYLQQSSDIRAALNDSTGLAINLNNIGEIYFEQQNYVNAIAFFEKSLVLSRHLKYVDLQRHTLDAIGAAHLKSNNHQSAYDYLQESVTLKDSLYSVEKAKAISEMETKYETEKKEQTIKNQQAELRIQRLVGFSILSVLLLIGLVVYYRIYQRRKYERQIQQLQIQQKIQKERERISRDLHDNVGANLTKIITDLDLLSLQLEMQQTEKSSQRIENTRNFTQSTIRVLRDTIWAMNKDAFSISEFADKTEAFLGYYLEDNMKWQVHRHIRTERQLTPIQVLNLLRILQEATQNMLKYAGAMTFTIDITSDENFILNIKDDGIGFDKNKVSTDEHYGLYNMEKRAADIGAMISLKSKVGEGVEIEVTV